MNPICWPCHGIQTPHANDVLYGRGGRTNHHPGNRRYRALVKAKNVCYNSTIRPERGSVAHQTVTEWRTTQRPPGRFLKFNQKSGMWDDVGDAKAREKTAQLFREEKASQLFFRLKKIGNAKNCGKGAEEVITEPILAAKKPLFSGKGKENRVSPMTAKVDLPRSTPFHALEFDERSGDDDDDFCLDGFTWDSESAISSQSDANQLTPFEDCSVSPKSVTGNDRVGICMNPHTEVVETASSTAPICNKYEVKCKPGRFAISSQVNVMTGMDHLVGEIGLLSEMQLDEHVASNGFYQCPWQGENLPVDFDRAMVTSHIQIVPMLKSIPRINASDKISHSGCVHECTPNADNAAQEIEPIELATPILLHGHGQVTYFSSTAELSPPPNFDLESASLRQWSCESQSFIVEQDLSFPPLILPPDNNVNVREFKDIDTVSTLKRKASNQIGSETHSKHGSAGVDVKQPSSMSNLNLHPEDQVEQSSLIEITSNLLILMMGLQANEFLQLSPSHRKSLIGSLSHVLTLMEKNHFPTLNINE